MAQTKSLNIITKSAIIQPYESKNVIVSMINPDTTDILNRIAIDDIRTWAKEGVTPDSLFSEDQLKQWAEDNGYVQSAP
jgi:hypothetical protein